MVLLVFELAGCPGFLQFFFTLPCLVFLWLLLFRFGDSSLFIFSVLALSCVVSIHVPSLCLVSLLDFFSWRMSQRTLCIAGRRVTYQASSL